MIRFNGIFGYSFTGRKAKTLIQNKTPDAQIKQKSRNKGYGSKSIPFKLEEAKVFIKGKTTEEIMNSIGMYKEDLATAIENDKKSTKAAYYRKTSESEDYFVPKPVHNIGEYAKYCINGKMILNEYIFPSTKWDYADIGIDENELIEDVAVIKNSLNLRHSAFENTGGIKYVGGDLVLDEKSKIKDLSSIEKISGSVIVATEESVEETAERLKNLKLNLDVIKGKIITIPSKVRQGSPKTNTGKKLNCMA